MLNEHTPHVTDGYNYHVNKNEVYEITATVEIISTYKEAKINLSKQLSEQIIKSSYVELNNHTDTKRLTATVGISSPGTKFNLVRDYIYTVQRQEFNEEQVKIALKNTYPEQFV